MKHHHLAWGALFLPACGGAESTPADATTDTATDAAIDSSLDSAIDSAIDSTIDTMPDAFGDGSCGDGSCERTDASIGDFPACPDCPAGWVCVHKPAGAAESTYCVRVPDCCGGVPTCECMSACACAPLYYRGCVSASATDIQCDGPISVRAAKTDIRYLTAEQRAVLAAQTLSTPLAVYRYRAEAPSRAPHLGFLIDDQPPASFAVAADRTHVDLYGYASMLLATIQQQQSTIEELQARIGRLEAHGGAVNRRSVGASPRPGHHESDEASAEMMMHATVSSRPRDARIVAEERAMPIRKKTLTKDGSGNAPSGSGGDISITGGDLDPTATTGDVVEENRNVDDLDDVVDASNAGGAAPFGPTRVGGRPKVRNPKPKRRR